MTKSKKHARPTLEETLEQPWCYYCEKTYSDVGALLSHQKDKHFQCPCRRRLNTAGGLKVHMAQVHKEELKEVPNALLHRKDPSVEVFTMYGIPEDVLRQHRQEVENEFHRQEYEHRVRTGNPVPGTAQPGAIKKPKIESSESLKARVAARRAENAKRKAEEAAGHSTTQATQTNGVNSANPSYPFSFNTGSNVFSAPPSGMGAYSALPGTPQYPGMPFHALPVSPAQYMPYAPIPSASPASLGHGSFPIPGQQPTHAIPAPPAAHAYSNGGFSQPDQTQSSNDDNDDEDEVTNPSAPLRSMSLAKLCKQGLQIIKAAVGSGKTAEAEYQPTDVFVAISEFIYSSNAAGSKFLAKAENVLRGLLNLGVESTLPTGFAHVGKISALKASTTSIPVAAEAEKPSKKKNAEAHMLSTVKSTEWEQDCLQMRSTGNGQSSNGPILAADGDGEQVGHG